MLEFIRPELPIFTQWYNLCESFNSLCSQLADHYLDQSEVTSLLDCLYKWVWHSVAYCI